MKMKGFLVLIILLIAAVSGASFAASSGSGSVTISAGNGSSGSSGGGFAQVMTASAYSAANTTNATTKSGDQANDPDWLKYGTAFTAGNRTTAPSWSPSTGTVGTVTTAGDIYYVEIANTGSGTQKGLVTLFLDNPAALAAAYSYLNLKIEIYKQTGSVAAPTWTTLSASEYLTLTSSSASFLLDEGQYTVTVDDSGSYYCTDATGTLAPSFYLKVDPA